MTRPTKLLPAVVAGPLAILALGACQVEIEAGETETRTYEVTEFDRIDIGSAFEVEILVGETTMVEIEAGENVHDRLDVTVDDGELKIDMDNVSILGNAPLNAVIHTPALVGLDISGAVEAEVDGIDTERFTLGASGASTLEAEGVIAELDADVSGASTIDLGAVEVGTADVDVSGASELDLTDAGSVVGEASGASSIDVDDDASVQVEVSGASSLG